MKAIKYLSIILALIVGMSACKLPDNVDPKNATEVPISTIFTNALVGFVNQVDEVNVNRNICRLLVQYWQETTYFDEARYNFLDRNIPDNYANRFYRAALMDFKTAKELLLDPEYGGNANVRDNMVNIITILESYSWQCLVDAFGNMPYSQALMGLDNTTPAYDDAATIYNDVIDNLTTAINALDPAFDSFDAADIMYGGDVASWKKFGASLLLRMGMRLADVNAAKSVETVNNALAAGVFASEDESGIFPYIGVVPHVNAIYYHFNVDNRKDYIPTNTIIDMMKGLEDPRLGLYFTEYEGEYVGGIAGLNGAQSYPNYSHFQDRFMAATFEAILIDYTEVEFWMAEAAARGGYNVTGTAEEHYNNAIESSILYWGGSADDVATYLASADVAWATAPGTYKQKIGTQKWIAFYNRAVEAWAEWRRLDYPQLNVPEEMTYNMIPKRMPYPYNEDELNGPNYEAAAAAIGGDLTTTKIFWDVFDPPF